MVSTELVLPGGQRLFTEGVDAQVYTSTHHDWADGLDASVGDVAVAWRVDFVGNGTTRGAEELLPPTAMRATH